MTKDELYFRNDLAVELVKLLTPIEMQQAIVTNAFSLADEVLARINADEEKLDAELAAARKKELDEMRVAIYPNKIERVDRREAQAAFTDPNQLRRRDDKVEVQEISVGQAIEMIASILGEKR